MDFGATHHFTPEFGNMIDATIFEGSEQTMVGNGKFIDISHIGNVMLSSLVKSIHLNHIIHTLKISK